MKFALIGFPLGHSASPFIHERLFALSGYDGTYEKCEVKSEKLDVKYLCREYHGLNVTIPHKTAVIPSLDSLCGNAQFLHTVNTIAHDGEKLIGYNTDADGFLKTLEISGIKFSGKALVCGSGGTARMIAALGVKNGVDITLCVRESGIAKANSVKSDIMRDFGKQIDIALQNEVSGEYDLMLNATPAGMYPKNIDLLPCGEDTISHCKAVFDAVYNPQRTKLINTALSMNKPVAYGLPMLVFQAAKAHTIWYGADFSNDDLMKIVEETSDYITKTF